MIPRRTMLSATLASFGTALLPANAFAQPAPEPRHVTHTFVKALPGRRDQLRRFLAQNWLVMDRKGIAAGIFTHATLYEVASVSDGADAAQADFVMVVGYRTPGGYADVEPTFDEIRRQHTTVLVDGLGFRELGRITGEQQVRPVASA